jgi:hypothetical protein
VAFSERFYPLPLKRLTRRKNSFCPLIIAKVYIATRGKWLSMEQEEMLKKYSGEWILLFNDEIVDHSLNLEDVLRAADEKYPAERFPADNIKISKVLSGSIHLH